MQDVLSKVDDIVAHTFPSDLTQMKQHLKSLGEELEARTRHDGCYE